MRAAERIAIQRAYWKKCKCGGKDTFCGRKLLVYKGRQNFLGVYLLLLMVLRNSGIRTQFLFALKRNVNMICMKCIVKNVLWKIKFFKIGYCLVSPFMFLQAMYHSPIWAVSKPCMIQLAPCRKGTCLANL